MRNKNVKNAVPMSKFEATMFACQKAKAQALKENKPAPTKKSSIKSNNRKVENALRRRRVVEDEEYDPEVDDTDLPADTATDAVVVIDPELDTDEYEANLDDLQAIIDETPEGEVPSTEEYVGNFVYTCPICGNNFFSDVEMTADEECPICGEVVDEFILVGDIESPEEALGSEEDSEDEGEEIDDLEADIDTDDIEAEGEDEELDVDAEIEESLTKDAGMTDEGEPIKKESYKYLINEKTLDPFLTKFIKENYKNAASMRAVSAKICGRTLKIECAIKFKSGSTKKTTITIENFRPTAKVSSLTAKADSAFKVESKKTAPFIFEAFTRGKVINFTGMKYSFITKKEGKRVQIYGKYALKENRSFSRGIRK